MNYMDVFGIKQKEKATRQTVTIAVFGVPKFGALKLLHSIMQKFGLTINFKQNFQNLTMG